MQGLAVGQVMSFGNHIPADGLFTAVFHFSELGAQTFDKVFQPAGHIHIGLADAKVAASRNPLARSIWVRPVVMRLVMVN